jgi:hypothetical protein
MINIAPLIRIFLYSLGFSGPPVHIKKFRRVIFDYKERVSTFSLECALELRTGTIYPLPLCRETWLANFWSKELKLSMIMKLLANPPDLRARKRPLLFLRKCSRASHGHNQPFPPATGRFRKLHLSLAVVWESLGKEKTKEDNFLPWGSEFCQGMIKRIVDEIFYSFLFI